MTRKKLIEVALPLDAINAESAREKSIRHGHPSTLHLWWARRPLAACRAVIFAQLVDDPDQPGLPPAYLQALDALPEPDKKELDWDDLSPGEQRRYKLFAFIEKLVKWENINDEAVIGTARQLIRAATDDNPPPLLDPFAGGGSIPLEAQRLGLEAHASDLNPVAVLINKALIEIPPKFANQPPVHPGQEQRLIQKEWRGAEGLAEDVRYYGQWMRDEAEKRIGHLYPKVTQPPPQPSPAGGGSDSSPQRGEVGRGAKPLTVIAWLWARTVPSPNPAANGAHVPLVSSFALSTKKGKETWVEPVIDRETMTYRFEIRSGTPNKAQWEKIKTGTKTKRGPNFFGLLTETPITGDHIKAEGIAGRMGAKLMAIVAEGPGGRIYLPPDDEHERIARSAESTWYPDAPIADDRRSMFTPLYGLTHFHHLFTPRQLVALTTFSDLVMEARARVEQDTGVAWTERQPPLNPPRSGGGDSDSSPQRGGSDADSSPQRGEVRRGANIWTPQPVPPWLLEAARRLRSQMTDAEHLLWQCLRRKQLGGFRFRKQHPLEKFVLDFYCPAARLAVELDGGQHNIAEGQAKDEERTAILGQHGIEVIRFWNNEVFTNLENVLQSIYDALLERVSDQRPPPQPSPAGGGSDSSPQRGEVGRGANSRAAAYADAVATYLAFAVDKMTDTNTTLCTWQNNPPRLRATFGRQALPMTWDYAEANIFGSAAGDYQLTIESLCKVLDRQGLDAKGKVRQQDAMKLNGDSPFAISTDPPYYDNIGYADLSDFFYVWLRRSLSEIYPDLFSTLLVPKAQELVATPYRFEGDKDKAQTFFEEGLGQAFTQMRQFAHSDYPLTVYYAFRQAETAIEGDTASTGWETMLEGLIKAGFVITGTWPIRSEMHTRNVGRDSNALASSIVLVCRPQPEDAPLTTRRDFLKALRQELPAALRQLQKGNIAPVDLAQASIGPGMAIFSRHSRVLESDGSAMRVRTALALINQALDEYLAEQEGEFEADTRWVLAWYEQFAFKDGPFGDAETLSKAKNTSVQGMVEAGLLKSGGGKVRLLKRSELKPDWNPAADPRLTVWEIVQHLIRALDKQGESGAAELLARVPPGPAEAARDLAYRLYTLCERKGWAAEALPYNSLVVAWPEVARLAREVRQSRPVQGRLV